MNNRPEHQSKTEQAAVSDVTVDGDFTIGEINQVVIHLGSTSYPATPPQAFSNWRIAHPYAAAAHFTGRQAERQLLSKWLNENKDHPLLVLVALGGFGKSALTWHWLCHDVKRDDWQKVMWWSFYEKNAEFNNFLLGTLSYLIGEEKAKSLTDPKKQLEELFSQLENSSMLLILDGFERELNAYRSAGASYQGDDLEIDSQRDRKRECTNSLAAKFLNYVATVPEIKGKILITTRLRPHELEAPHGNDLLQGCQEKELKQMEPADAVKLFQALGIKGRPAEIKRLCERCGYHPLILRVLAGLAYKNWKKPGDISVLEAIDWPEGDIKQRQHHVLEQAYNNLTPTYRKLLSRLAAFRHPVSYEALRGIAAIDNGEEFNSAMDDLVLKSLVNYNHDNQSFDLHPIVRRYAYDRLQEKETIHSDIKDYFAAVPPPDVVECLEDLTNLIELYVHTVRAGQHQEAFKLFLDRLNRTLYFQLGEYQKELELLRTLFPDGKEYSQDGITVVLPKLSRETDQAWVLNELANCYSLTGQPFKAASLFDACIKTYEKEKLRDYIAICLRNQAIQQLLIGELQLAETNLRSVISLCQEIKNNYLEAMTHEKLGLLLAYRGEWNESEKELSEAQDLFKKRGNKWGEISTHSYKAFRLLLLERYTAIFPEATISREELASNALIAAQKSLELAEKAIRHENHNRRFYVQVNWILGAAYRVCQHLQESEQYLNFALEECRKMDLQELEVDVLLELARIHLLTEQFTEAQKYIEDAQFISQRCQYRLQQADANLLLAFQARAKGDDSQAKNYAHEVIKLARCKEHNSYKVAYEEARIFLLD